MLKRATVTYSAAQGWYVDLPTFLMQEGSWLTITPGLIDGNGVLPNADPKAVLALGPSCVVELPDNTPLDASGQISKKALAIMYAGTRFANPAYVPPVLAEP